MTTRTVFTFDSSGNVVDSIDLDSVLEEVKRRAIEDATSATSHCNTRHTTQTGSLNQKRAKGEGHATAWRNQSNSHCTNRANDKRGQAQRDIDTKFNWFVGEFRKLKPANGWNQDGTRQPPPPPQPPNQGGGRRGRCFARNTRCVMSNGEIMFIQDIVVGDVLKSGGQVVAVLALDSTDVQMYNIYGVTVSGDHAVEFKGKFVRAEEHPHAVATYPVDELYNIITEHHRIVVMGNDGPIVCADYEETDDTDADLDRYLHELNSRQ